ncbi:hypothetical protein ABZ023_32135 [Streptomyces sp. NPDC006367]|uniref:hypothetical protein n=1 Tax=unclassified Streptomyces TaxID=2593676 RepID=UPI0033A319B5
MTFLRLYGMTGLLDLCTLLVLRAVDRCPAELRDAQDRPDLSKIIVGKSDALTTIDTASSANTRLHRGSVTADDLTSAEEQIERINGLEPVVTAALQTRPGHPKARRNVRRTLSEQGEGAGEGTAIFGILSEVMEAVGRRTSPIPGPARRALPHDARVRRPAPHGGITWPCRHRGRGRTSAPDARRRHRQEPAAA